MLPLADAQAQPRFASPPFQLGVASGDPSADGFVIWTRLAPEPFDPGYLGKAMWGLSMPGGATGFDLAWPALQNVQVWCMQQSVAPNWNAYQLWVDKTKPPAA